jgi:Flp pilus assembly protein TadG
MLVVFAVMAAALIMFIGLGLDAGIIYVTKSVLSKALDAAVITAVRNLGRGQNQAAAAGRDAFAGNYHGGGAEASPTSLNIAFNTDADNNLQVRADASTTIHTYFIRLVPRFRTFTVNGAAQATRANLIMSVVPDRSGSMTGNGGDRQLPPAVAAFINYFDDTRDKVAMTSFASHARADVAMSQPFKSSITSAVDEMVFVGGTFADGGLTLGYNQIQATPVTPGENVIKVAVFFTDGLANEFQYTWPPSHTYNIGGYDSGNRWGVFNINTGSQLATCTPDPPFAFNYMTSFQSLDGTTKSLTSPSAGNNVRLEARLRAEATATAMRNSGIAIYCIGLGTDATIDKAFLRRLANDPSATTHNPSQPVGMAVFTPNSTELQRLFETIAATILMRLTM